MFTRGLKSLTKTTTTTELNTLSRVNVLAKSSRGTIRQNATSAETGVPNPPIASYRVAKDSKPASEVGLHEEIEVIGEWGLDSDNTIKSAKEALFTLVGALAVVGGIYFTAANSKPEKNKPTAKRVLPYNNGYLARGGDPKNAE
eukprot:TRINITY_DN157_c0_g1_i5.p1 TRINITY_DN157_c0_g1~~TRINITY_DN157_c0_g1_i5.p1  ORF type:complete len:144 (+),score=32.20 TRINITY_DN157_c0_g1_i5:627-1058(+)